MQCGNPSCSTVCPVIATTKDEEGGIVSQIYPRCIGCRYCMAACPYHARYFNWYDPIWPEGLDKVLTDNVSVRPRGVVEKCTFCHHKWQEAKRQARYNGEDPYNLPEDAYIPACVEACPTGAMVFGDLKNPKHKVAKLAKSPNAFRLLEKLGTDPQVYYLSEREWVRREGDNYLKNEKTKGE
jgi:molybdopterin-containing oxidoreductase family iron-sulfur binding subunit